MKKVKIIAMVALISLIITGCGSKKPDVDSVKTNSVTASTSDNKNNESSDNKIQDFNKKDSDVLDDLKSNNIGVQLTDDVVITLTYGSDGSQQGYIPIKQVNKFTIESVNDFKGTSGVVDNVKAWKEVTAATDVNFELNDNNNELNRNGKYNAKGTFIILYHYEKGSDNKFAWHCENVKSMSDKFKTTKVE